MDPKTPTCPPPSAASEGAPDGQASRRDFLQGALRLASGAFVLFSGGALAAGLHKPGAPGEGYDWSEHRYAYLIDTQKCIGCGSCARACTAENDVPEGFFRTWIERYAVSTEDSHVDSPNGGKDGFPPLQVGFEVTKSFFVPKICNHCKETPCIQVCPVGASYRTKDGAVLVDGERCIGCGYCVQACPYGSRFILPETHTASKCTWCYHRITKGLKPGCVEACPTGARMFGDMKRDGDPVRHAIEHDRVAILQGHLLTEPQCFYLHLDKEVR